MAKETSFQMPRSFFPKPTKADWTYGGTCAYDCFNVQQEVFLRNGLLVNYFGKDEAFRVRINQNRIEVIEGSSIWVLYDFSATQPWQLPEKALPQLGCLGGSILSVVERDFTVEVPAGTFTNCIRIQWQSPCDDWITEEIFAPNVGLVLRYGQGELASLELFSAKVGDHEIFGDNVSLNCSVSPSHFRDHLTVLCQVATSSYEYLLETPFTMLTVWLHDDEGNGDCYGCVGPPAFTEFTIGPGFPFVIYQTFPVDPALPPGRYWVDIYLLGNYQATLVVEKVP